MLMEFARITKPRLIALPESAITSSCAGRVSHAHDLLRLFHRLLSRRHLRTTFSPSRAKPLRRLSIRPSPFPLLWQLPCEACRLGAVVAPSLFQRAAASPLNESSHCRLPSCRRELSSSLASAS